jgi:Fe-S-cluster containining protein
MVSADEIRAIIEATGLSWEAIAEPYPEVIKDTCGRRYTLGWCLVRNHEGCRFHALGKCMIYTSRPWICRTYPFMLDGDELVIFECKSIGQSISSGESWQIAQDLLSRKKAEDEEAERVRKILLHNPLPAGSFIVVDSEGMKVIDG